MTASSLPPTNPLQRLRRRLAPLTLLVFAAPAAAQTSRVQQIPASNVFCVEVRDDTIVAGAETAVFVSTDGGTSWRRSAQLAPAVTSIQAVRLHRGRLYAGTFGQGVFVSDDLGATWSPFNQGLTGGPLDSQRFVSSFEAFGDNLYVGTFGAGVYARRLSSGGWTHFGEVLEPEQASNVNTIAIGGGRILAAGGSNGNVFWRERGDADWTPSGLGPNDRSLPGVQAHSLFRTSNRWVVGTSAGIFLSASGQAPWTLSSLGVVPLRWSALTMRGSTLVAAFDLPTAAVIEVSPDEGQSWEFVETQPGVFVFALAAHGDELFAARADGLWRSLAFAHRGL